jgi:DNA-binding response OmpR family regulator
MPVRDLIERVQLAEAGHEPWRRRGRDLDHLGKRVLVVDDEADTRALIWDILKQEGYDVLLCSSGEHALRYLEPGRFDLVLADIKMPGMSGLELLNRVRQVEPDVRVILMTAYASVETAVQAVRGQAFDYLIKPFDLGYFRQRVERAVLGRSLPDVMRYKDLTIDRQARWIWVKNHRIGLTRLEFDVLSYLFERLGAAVSHEDLLEHVWGYDQADERTVATVKSCMSRLRKKLGDDAGDPRYIFNVWGVGYRLGE